MAVLVLPYLELCVLAPHFETRLHPGPPPGELCLLAHPLFSGRKEEVLTCLLKGGGTHSARGGHSNQSFMSTEELGASCFTGEGLVSLLLLWAAWFLKNFCFPLLELRGEFCASQAPASAKCRSSRLLELGSFIGTPFGRGNSSENPPLSAL